MLYRLLHMLEITLVYLVFSALFSYSNPPLTDQIERIRAYTRTTEFNYITWTMNAALVKVQAASIDLPFTLERATQKRVVTEYLNTTRLLLEKEYALQLIYVDATITDKLAASTDLRYGISGLRERQNELAPLAEAILQEQVASVLAETGLTALGQPIPSVLYHTTPLPLALIVSPRDHIEQLANISLNTDLPLEQQDQLENRIDTGLDHSSLVVSIGGVGVYPTMVMQTTNLPWLLNTISHEWIHNYLTLRPLGLSYMESAELRTMNETTASIAGDEIGTMILERYYPELLAAYDSHLQLIDNPFDHREPGDDLRPAFDFRAEMHTTRVTADALLAEERIEQAEEYMEARRLLFLQNGYMIRKLNQAYFAFYGAYADVPGGAAGEDPVGPAVRALRARSASLADFIHTIAWMNSFEDLQKALEQ